MQQLLAGEGSCVAKAIHLTILEVPLVEDSNGFGRHCLFSDGREWALE